jgi:hypothetical protein
MPYLEAQRSTHTFEFQSDYARRLRAEARGDALLEVLGARGWDVPDEIRRRITDCTDPERLNSWLLRAVDAASLNEVFD